MSANGSKPRNGGPRPRIDWAAAFAYYATMELPRTYVAVADRYGVTEGAVRKHAKSEGWEERVHALDEVAAKKLEARTIRTLEQRKLRTIEVTEKLRDRVLDVPDDVIDVDTAVRALPRYVRLELLDAGEPTDRLELSEVREQFSAWLRVLAEIATPEQFREFLSRLKRDGEGETA